ncbi:hypothetical protein [Vibrio sp. V37_P2S8PM304]|uniref:hypothetical protein n=1 Tax=unclassified Vibrio TaxID=2614977 RepID=UPI003FCE56D5
MDIHLPQGAQQRFVLVSMKKDAAGQSRALLDTLWPWLQPLSDARFVVLCDDDVNVRDWNDVIWAITTRMDPARDTIQYPATEGQSSKLALDATNKFDGEVQREWGTPIQKDPQLVAKIDAIWDKLGIL